MAIPSSKYVLEDITISGLVCKRTTQAVKDIYPIYSTLDNSIAYTKPKSDKYTTMTNMLLPSNFPQRAYDRVNYLQNHYYNSSSHTTQSWSTLGQIIGNNKGDTSVLLNWTFASDDTEYMFNGSQGTAVIGNGNQKFITDFDVSHVIFTYSIKGYAKADFDTWKAGGSAPSVIDITIKNLIDNPDNYYVYRFGAVSSVVWNSDTSQWVSSTAISPTCLIDGGNDIQGIERPSHVFGYKMGTVSGDYSGGINADNYKLYSATENYTISDSTQYIRKGGIPYGLVVNNSYGIGSAPDEWVMKPGWTSEACSQYLETLNAATTDESLNPELYYDNGFVQIYGGDLFSTGKNYNTAVQGEYHYTKWNKRNSYVTKGSVICEFLATIGCYFFTESNIAANTLNNDGITPDTLSTIPSIGLGVMNEDGTTEGRWILGNDIDDYDGINKKGSVIHPDFNPSGGGGGGSTGDDMESMATGATGSSGGFTHFYVMSPADLIDFLDDFYTRADAGETLTNNLVCSYILGIPSSEFCATEDVQIVIHNSAQGTPFVSQANYSHITATNNLLVIGSFDVPRMTNTFYDFAPYSTYEVFIPCCGWVSLPDTVAGRRINVEMYIDIASCCLKATVKIDDLGVCAVTNGILGAAIPIAVIESGILRGNNIQAGLGIIGGGINTGIGAGNGNALGIGFGVQQILGGLIECTVAGNTNYTQQKGGTGDITQFAMGHKCYMKVTHPDIDEVVNNSIFGHSVGYLCNSIGKLSEYSGFTVCGNPHVTFSASAEEREEIERLLSMGVIL